MAAINHEAETRPHEAHRFQCSLASLFLVALVLASSLAMFGSRGIAAFVIAGALAV